MSKKVKIMSDSTCDLPESLLKEFNISILGLFVNFDEKFIREGDGIHPDEVYDFFEKTGRLTKTAAASVQDYLDVFTPYVEQDIEIVYINLTSEISCCYQNACIAAKEIGNVYPVDSRHLSSGQGLVVLEAAELAQKGLSASEIAENLKAFTSRVHTSFVIDTLEYLHKGGRCSALAAFGANFLKLKPSIILTDGKLLVGKKYRGNIQGCLKEYVTDQIRQYKSDLDLRRVFITHSFRTGEEVEAVKEVRNILQENASFEKIYEQRAGITISTHCGPNTLGILFVTNS